MKRVIRGIGIRASSFFWNIFTLLAGIFIHRDNEVILCGAWMGEKFADNPRFLYQYLQDNKIKLNLKKVIWATRSIDVFDKLRLLGYDVVLCGTKDSMYWHLKAGMHILCDISYVDSKFMPDIDIRYSFTAKKIQLWHGVGIKSIGEGAHPKNINKLVYLLTRSRGSKYLFGVGGWTEAYFLCTSELDKKIMRHNLLLPDDVCFLSSYPRNDQNQYLFEEEKAIKQIIEKYQYSLIYLPTFRSDYSNYRHPLESQRFVDYLDKNGILWIDKQHQASNDTEENIILPRNVLMLDKDFDINTILGIVSCVVSDYSSVVFDGIYLNIPVILYVPDLDNYKNGDVGLIMDFDECFPTKIQAVNTADLIETVESVIEGSYFSNEVIASYKKIRHLFYDDKESSCAKVWEDICNLK